MNLSRIWKDKVRNANPVIWHEYLEVTPQLFDVRSGSEGLTCGLVLRERTVLVRLLRTGEKTM